MELEISDVFDRLAFMEALSFENFELAMLLTSLRMNASYDISSNMPLVISAKNNSRLFVISGETSARYYGVSMRDIVCVYPFQLIRSDAAMANCRQVFCELASLGLRTCLIYRFSLPQDHDDMALAAKPQHWIEWATPYSNKLQRSGLVFSSSWREGTLDHVARVVRNFMTTLPPEDSMQAHLQIRKNIV